MMLYRGLSQQAFLAVSLTGPEDIEYKFHITKLMAA